MALDREQHRQLIEKIAEAYFKRCSELGDAVITLESLNDDSRAKVLDCFAAATEGLREALEQIKAGAALGKEMFENRVRENEDRLTWWAVNVLQDNLEACFGTAYAALYGTPHERR